MSLGIQKWDHVKTNNKQSITNPENKPNMVSECIHSRYLLSGCQGKEKSLLLKVWPLIGCLSASGRPHRDKIIDITNWTLWVKKRKAWSCLEGPEGELGGRNEGYVVYYIHLWNSERIPLFTSIKILKLNLKHLIKYQNFNKIFLQIKIEIIQGIIQDIFASDCSKGSCGVSLLEWDKEAGTVTKSQS